MTPGFEALSELTKECLKVCSGVRPCLQWVIYREITSCSSRYSRKTLTLLCWEMDDDKLNVRWPFLLVLARSFLWCEISGFFQENEHLSVRQYIFLFFKHSETAATLIRTSQTRLRMWTTCRRHGPFLQSSHKHSPGITSDCYRIQRIFGGIVAVTMFRSVKSGPTN